MTKPTMILGGGLAGLSACYHGDGIIYEQHETSGGQARSHARDGFVFDEGIHVLHTSNEYVLELMETIGADLETKERNAWIHSHGSMTRYPFQANTYGLPVEIVKDCLLGFIKNDFGDRDKVKNYEDWLYFMFGKGIAEHFMIPYSRKFWGVEPSALTTEWVNVRHPRPSVEEVVTGALEDQTKGFGINAVFRYPREGGYGRIGEALTKCVEGRIRYGMKATMIDAGRREVEFNAKTLVGYDTILSTVPLPDLIGIIPDAPDGVREAVGRLRTNSMLAVSLGVNRPNITDKHWIYFLEKEFSFVRISFPFNQAASTAPSGTSSILAEIAYGNDNPLPVSRDRIVDRVVADLVKGGVLRTDDEIVFSNIVDIKYGYVLYDFARRPALEIVHNYLKSIGITPCGRYGLWGYLWSDEAILSGKKAAETLARS